MFFSYLIVFEVLKTSLGHGFISLNEVTKEEEIFKTRPVSKLS